MTHPINVLLLDDNQLVLESVSAWLEDDGFNVHTAPCGEDALQLLRTIAIDLVMVDLKLPDMNGETFIIQTIRQYPAARFIIHTGTHSYRLPFELQNLGLQDDDIVYKPILSLPLLTKMIRTKVQGAPY
ncbi:MAG: response regulator [Acetobacterium sp.]|nr:response regulator [Acetobacterium sp.]